MLVVLFMAGVTIHRSFLVAIVRMAADAGDFDMLVAELIPCLVVVESDFFPIAISMAINACASQLAFVFIVFFVAAVTIGRRLTIFGLGFVAGRTLDLFRVGMGALEREVRPFMIEGQFRNRRNILLSAFVFCMASLAIALFLESPVRSSFLFDINANVFVTILAECLLRRLIETLMAFCAIVLPFRMAFDHFPRHQCRLDGVSPGRCGHKRQDAEDE